MDDAPEPVTGDPLADWEDLSETPFDGIQLHDHPPWTLDEKLDACEAAVRYRFQDRVLLERCLTHSSVANQRLDSNERLEFLGDSVLGLIVCEMLYREFPEESEGELTRLKSALVSRRTCARVSVRHGLDRCLLLGKGLQMHGQIPPSVNAAVFESLVAGVYLDGGLEAARAFVGPIMAVELEAITEEDQLQNFKSLLQQHAQKEFNETPVYRLLDEKGPDHSKCFKITAVIGSQTFPAAWGTNKKQAEQRAARNAMAQLEGREAPYVAE
jgi:ribonuclease III